MKKLFKKNPPRFVFFAGLSFVFMLLAVFGLLTYYQKVTNKDVIAIVGGEKIAKSDYLRAKEVSERISEISNNDSYSDSNSVKNRLIEEKLIKMIAAENNITVTDEDIDNQIGKAATDVKDPYEVYGSSFGYTKGELRERAKLSLLRDRIEEKLLADKSGRFVFFRFNENNSVESIMNIKTEELESWALSMAKETKAKLDSGISFDSVFNEIEDAGKNPAYSSRYIELNEKTPKDLDKTEREEFAKVKQGKYSDIIKTETYYSIYYVDKEGSGSFSSWKDLIDSYTKMYVKYSFSLSVENKYLALKADTLEIKNKVLAFVSTRTPFAFAGSCSGCSGCDGSGLSGEVRDSVDTSIKINGASVRLYNNSPFCNGNTSLDAYCGDNSKTTTTDSSGDYSFARRDGSGCFANCGSPTNWLMSVSVTGWTDVSDVNVNSLISNGSSGTKNFNLTPSDYLFKVKNNPVNGGVITGTDINCGTNCSNRDYRGRVRAYTATANSGYQFKQWRFYSGNTTWSGTATVDTTNPKNVSFTTDRSAIADYNVNLSVNANPSSGGTVSGGGFKDYNSTATASAAAASGYRFINWTGDCSGSSTSATVTMDSPKSCTANFEINNTPPNVTLNSPGADTKHFPPVALSATVSDPDGDTVDLGIFYKRADYPGDWTKLLPYGGFRSSPYQRVANTAINLGPGDYFWGATGKDSKGAEVTITRKFTIDSPSCTLSPINSTINDGESTNLTYSMTPLSGVTFTINGSSKTIPSGVVNENLTSRMTYNGEVTYTNNGSKGTCSATVLVRRLSCVVFPGRGPKPLIVTTRPSIEEMTNATVTIRKDGDPTWSLTGIVNKGADFIRTLTDPGTYRFTVKNTLYKGGAEQPCNPVTVEVYNPNNNTGGEVSP